jgi:hypothetical protein
MLYAIIIFVLSLQRWVLFKSGFIMKHCYHILQAAKSGAGKRQEEAVTALREMRVVPKRLFNAHAWRWRVKVC